MKKLTEIADIIKGKEGKTLEFKRDLSSFKPIMRTLIAFANTAGGTLVIGRDDSGEITGIEDVLQAEESIANAIADSIMPALMPDIEIITYETKDLLILRAAHWSGPFYLKNEGPEDGVYVRLGSTNRKAGPEILAELHRTVRRVSFDQEPCPELGEDNLDLAKAESAFKSVNRSIDKHKLESLGLVVPYAGRKTVSHGCLILFGKEKDRSRFFPDARVSCARFRGIDKSQFIDRLDIQGSILDAVNDVPIFIRRNTRLLSKIESFKREDIPAYPQVAVREVLVNALVHSDYSLTGMRILISIFSDRMEIQNPGMLPFGITMEDFKAGVSKVRNRVIARIFTELGLMEEGGSGYKRILNACGAGGYPEPEWAELGTAVRVIFYPHPETVESEPTDVPVNVPVNNRQKWFLNQIGKGVQVSSSELSAQWDISQKTAKRDIADLKQKGLIEFSGASKNGYYRLKS